MFVFDFSLFIKLETPNVESSQMSTAIYWPFGIYFINFFPQFLVGIEKVGYLYDKPY